MAKKQPAKKKDAVAVQDNVPDFVKREKAQGMEGIGVEDLEIPRLKLMQAISPLVMEGDAEAGEFVHSVTETPISKGGEFQAVPIFMSKAFILWSPRHEDGGILARADDGVHWKPGNGEFKVCPIKGSKEQAVWKLAPTVEESGLDQFGSSQPSDPNSKPAATKMYNLLVDIVGHPEMSPCAVSLQRSTIKQAKKLASKLKIATEKDSIPLWALKLKISSVVETSDDGDYYNWSIKLDGYNEDEESYKRCEGLYKAVTASGFKVKDDDEDDKPAPDDGEGDY